MNIIMLYNYMFTSISSMASGFGFVETATLCVLSELLVSLQNRIKQETGHDKVKGTKKCT